MRVMRAPDVFLLGASQQHGPVEIVLAEARFVEGLAHQFLHLTTARPAVSSLEEGWCFIGIHRDLVRHHHEVKATPRSQHLLSQLHRISGHHLMRVFARRNGGLLSEKHPSASSHRHEPVARANRQRMQLFREG